MLPYIYIGQTPIPTYGLCMAMGIIVACLVSFVRLKKRNEHGENLLLVGAVGMVFALIFAKAAYYVFSYGISRLISEILSGNFTGFENAGLVYYGGLVGGVIGGVIAIKCEHLPYRQYCDAIVPCIPLGHAFGRIGCLLSGCCFGQEYTGSIAVHTPFLPPETTAFPIQLVEVLVNVGIFIVLVRYATNDDCRHQTLSLYVLLYGIARFILECFRGDLVRGIFGGLSSSQWISIACIVASLTVILFSIQKRKSKLEEE